MKTLRGHLKSWAVGLVAVMLTSLYPCIFIFAQNAGEAKLGDTRLFACIFLLTAFAMLLVTGVIFRNMSRAAFMTCLGMLVVINFTMVSQANQRKATMAAGSLSAAAHWTDFSADSDFDAEKEAQYDRRLRDPLP